MLKYEIKRADWRPKSDFIPGAKGRVYRIVALVDILHRARAGEEGGYIESPDNLSQVGKCWVGEDAVVMDSAYVHDDAYVGDNAIVCESAGITDWAVVRGNAMVSGLGQVNRHATVEADAHVYGNATITDYAEVSGKARVGGDAVVMDSANVFGDATVEGHAYVEGMTCIRTGHYESDVIR
jgi:carbonic anhydrase/acetyltransferase-like protein (isoleucine patch superfamily)